MNARSISDGVEVESDAKVGETFEVEVRRICCSSSDDKVAIPQG